MQQILKKLNLIGQLKFFFFWPSFPCQGDREKDSVQLEDVFKFNVFGMRIASLKWR